MARGCRQLGELLGHDLEHRLLLLGAEVDLATCPASPPEPPCRPLVRVGDPRVGMVPRDRASRSRDASSPSVSQIWTSLATGSARRSSQRTTAGRAHAALVGCLDDRDPVAPHRRQPLDHVQAAFLRERVGASSRAQSRASRRPSRSRRRRARHEPGRSAVTAGNSEEQQVGDVGARLLDDDHRAVPARPADVVSLRVESGHDQAAQGGLPPVAVAVGEEVALLAALDGPGSSAPASPRRRSPMRAGSAATLPDGGRGGGHRPERLVERRQHSQQPRSHYGRNRGSR